MFLSDGQSPLLINLYCSTTLPLFFRQKLVIRTYISCPTLALASFSKQVLSLCFARGHVTLSYKINCLQLLTECSSHSLESFARVGFSGTSSKVCLVQPTWLVTVFTKDILTLNFTQNLTNLLVTSYLGLIQQLMKPGVQCLIQKGSLNNLYAYLKIGYFVI